MLTKILSVSSVLKIFIIVVSHWINTERSRVLAALKAIGMTILNHTNSVGHAPQHSYLRAHFFIQKLNGYPHVAKDKIYLFGSGIFICHEK